MICFQCRDWRMQRKLLQSPDASAIGSLGELEVFSLLPGPLDWVAEAVLDLNKTKEHLERSLLWCEIFRDASPLEGGGAKIKTNLLFLAKLIQKQKVYSIIACLLAGLLSQFAMWGEWGGSFGVGVVGEGRGRGGRGVGWRCPGRRVTDLLKFQPCLFSSQFV